MITSIISLVSGLAASVAGYFKLKSCPNVQRREAEKDVRKAQEAADEKEAEIDAAVHRSAMRFNINETLQPLDVLGYFSRIDLNHRKFARSIPESQYSHPKRNLIPRIYQKRIQRGMQSRLITAKVPRFPFPDSPVIHHSRYHFTITSRGIVSRSYLNGIVYSEKTASSIQGTSGKYKLKIGNTYRPSDNFFDGSVCCLRIYNRALEYGDVNENNRIDKTRFNIP